MNQNELVEAIFRRLVDAASTEDTPTVERRLNKRLITEKDIIAAHEAKVTCLCVEKNSMITAQAVDTAHDLGVTLRRE